MPTILKPRIKTKTINLHILLFVCKNPTQKQFNKRILLFSLFTFQRIIVVTLQTFNKIFAVKSQTLSSVSEGEVSNTISQWKYILHIFIQFLFLDVAEEMSQQNNTSDITSTLDLGSTSLIKFYQGKTQYFSKRWK